MKNKLTDLNDALFAQLERLSDEGMSTERLADELKRTAAIVQVSDKIVDTARLQLEGMKVIAEHGSALQKHLPAMSSQMGLLAAPKAEDRT